MGLLDGLRATNRKEPDRLAEIAPACRISRARVVDSGRIVKAGGIASGMELGFHLLRRAGTARISSQRSPGSWSTARRTSSIAAT